MKKTIIIISIIFLSIITILAVGFFYWLQIRPAQIRKECSIKIIGAYQKNYEKCLLEHGLEK